MNQNSALEALCLGNAAKADSTAVVKVINGLRTCGPLFSSVFGNNTNDHNEDIATIIGQTKELIDDVMRVLESKNIELDDLKKSGINAFCIKVSAESWSKEEEVIPNLANSIADALIQQGISSEITFSEFENPLTQNLITNISSSAFIFSSINKYKTLQVEQDFVSASMSSLAKATNRAVKKLSEFHIPHEDEDVVRHHIMIEGCNILVSIIDRNITNHLHEIKKSSITGDTVELGFSFEKTNKDFNEAIDVFIQSIYVNSRIID
jgi:hypothetical protein